MTVFDLKKKIVVYSEDNKKWFWKDYSLKNIAKSKPYADVKVGDDLLPEFLQKHRTCLTPEDKQLLWSALDARSQDRIKTFWQNPEIKIAMVTQPIEDDDTIVAFFEYIPNYYNGELQDFMETKDQVFYTNSNINYTNFMETSPNFKWLPKMIAIGKQFDVTPSWFECKHSGKRGLGLTAHAAKEFQAIVNWYIGNAELGEDYSDTVELHHKNPVIDAVIISRREYLNNKDSWDDWKEMDTYDFLAPLHGEDEDEDME